MNSSYFDTIVVVALGDFLALRLPPATYRRPNTGFNCIALIALDWG